MASGPTGAARSWWRHGVVFADRLEKNWSLGLGSHGLRGALLRIPWLEIHSHLPTKVSWLAEKLCETRPDAFGLGWDWLKHRARLNRSIQSFPLRRTRASRKKDRPICGKANMGTYQNGENTNGVVVCGFPTKVDRAPPNMVVVGKHFTFLRIVV